MVLLKQCDPTAATSTSRTAASSAIKRATSLFEQLFPNITRDPLRQDEAGQERSNYSCFCPNRSLSATTPRLSLVRLVLLLAAWTLATSRGGRQSCVNTPLLLPSRFPPRHPQSSFPLHDVRAATAAVAFSSQSPSFVTPISSLRILHHFFLTITLQWPHSL